MRRFLPRGVTARLIIYLALIGVLPPLVVGTASYHVSQRIVREEMQRHAAQLMQAQSEYLEAQVDQIEGLIGNVLGVEAVSEAVGREGGDRDAYDQLATQARIGYLLNGYMDVRGLVSIDVFTSGGRHYHVGDTLDVHSIDERQRDAMFAAVTHEPDKTLWIGVETNVNGKSRFPRVITTARAINTYDMPEQGSRVAGLLLISQDLEYRYNAYRSLEADMPGELLLIDGRDRVIYNRNPNMLGAQVPASVMAALSGAPDSMHAMIDGAEMLVSHVKSSSTGWRLVSLVPLQELDARSLPIKQATTLAIVACLVVIAMAALSFSRSVVAPLRRIRQGFQELQRGRSASMRPLPVPGRDEVGDLTVWFNTFLESWGARERSELALRESETRFRVMHEASLTGLCVHHEGLVLEANLALCREFGRDYDALIGTRLSDLFAADTPVATLAKLTLCEARGIDVEAVRADGSRFPAELSSRTMPFRGNRAHVVEVRNIEARKRAEEELERMKNVAEVANHAKSQFLATMSHEIRTPMNAVLGLAHLLQDRPLGPVEHDMVRKIRNAGRSLLGIINDILDFSKIEAGRLDIEHAPFRLGDVLDNVATIMAAASGTKDIELIVGSVPVGAMFLVGDALRLEQILTNLVSNAIKFTEAGEVMLTISVADTRSGHIDLRFAVRDTGIGIPNDKQEEIFSAFSQAENSTTRRFGGTGLGLTITRRIVTLMGGVVSLTSAPGRGSEFSFVIPLALDEQESSSAPAPPANLRVLIADDHPVALGVLATISRSLGWTTDVTSSGEDAMTCATAAINAGKQFDVLLFDCKKPGINGLEIAARLRATPTGRQASPIIMVMTHNKSDLLPDALADMVDAILAKPITASTMYNTVNLVRRNLTEQQDKGGHRRKERRLAGLSILVVDDSDINREVAHQILRNEGARVLLAPDGSKALETLRAAPQDVHVVLMDIQMPVMDGYEATRQIRDILRLTELPVLALSASAFKDQQAATLKAGMNGFVAKPFDVDNLVSTILRLTGGRAIATAAFAEDAQIASPIDVERGLRNWKDDVVYASYLQRFAATHSEDGSEIARLLAEGRPDGAATCLHKLKGAAGAMALTTVMQSADKLEQALGQGKDTGSAVRELRTALDAARSAIASYSGSKPENPKQAMTDRSTNAHLLNELLLALDLDNPDQAGPIVAALSSHLAADRIAALLERLDAFDFRGAEALTRAIADDPASFREKLLDEPAFQ